MKRFQITPAVYLVLIKNGKILLSKRCNTGYEDGNYSMVSGHLEGNETFRETMVREAKEEAGLEIEIKGLEVMHIMHRSKPEEREKDERVDVFISAKKWVGEPKIMEPDKCDDLSWFDLDNLPKNIIPFLRYAIKNINKDIFYSEFGW